MILGFNVYYDGAGTTPYYTSSFPRRGQAALFSVQATHFFGTSTLVVTVEHRNREDASWSSAGVFDNITSTGLKWLSLSALKEEIRYAFTFNPGGVAGDFFRIFIPPPGWRPYT